MYTGNIQGMNKVYQLPKNPQGTFMGSKRSYLSFRDYEVKNSYTGKKFTWEHMTGSKEAIKLPESIYTGNIQGSKRRSLVPKIYTKSVCDW